ncbi:MAG: hypothetical protein QM783_10985 [Phycisphaerales bacterium]
MRRLKMVLKYCSALLALLCAVLWVATGRLYVGYIGDRTGLAIFAGQIEYSHETANGGMPFNYAGREGWHTDISRTWEWRNGFEHFPPIRGMGTREVYYIPVWWFSAATAALAAVLWWRLRTPARTADLICSTCGYSLKGIGPGSACPECGK